MPTEKTRLTNDEAERRARAEYPYLVNRAMARKLVRGEALDLAARPKTREGWYVLDAFVDGVDYCDTSCEQWIWSIGRTPSGAIFASRAAEFYQYVGPLGAVECLFLR